jgi:tRNA pseudouridine13 synthase
MRWKASPEDFVVEEEVSLDLSPAGPYAIYRLEKVGRDSLSVRAELARRLGKPQADVIFPALKDAVARTVQWVGVRAGGPAKIAGRGFIAERVGFADRPPDPRNLRGNRFTVVLRDLSPTEARLLPATAAQLGSSGWPNYFDDQRFGSLVEGYGPFGRAVLRADDEMVLRLYLAVPWTGDPARVRAFKAEAARSWGDWDRLFSWAPVRTNFRSLLTFLRDHPNDYRRAVRLIPARLLMLAVDAYRSWVWNLAVSRFFEENGPAEFAVTVAGCRLAVPAEPRDSWSATEVPLPHPRASYSPPWDRLVADLLKADGLTLADLAGRGRLPDRPSPTRRVIWVRPDGVSFEASSSPEMGILRFSLPPGAYGTLLLKVLAARLAALAADAQHSEEAGRHRPEDHHPHHRQDEQDHDDGHLDGGLPG